MIGNKKKLIQYLLEQEDDKMFEIKEKREKRSLNANNLFYKLQNQLAGILGLSNEELHFMLLKRYSEEMLVPLPVDVNPKGYFIYFERYKEAVINGKEAVYYKVYKASREMDKKEFSRLLDGVISEAKEMGIETMTPSELAQFEDYIGGIK